MWPYNPKPKPEPEPPYQPSKLILAIETSLIYDNEKWGWGNEDDDCFYIASHSNLDLTVRSYYGCRVIITTGVKTDINKYNLRLNDQDARYMTQVLFKAYAQYRRRTSSEATKHILKILK